MSDDEAERGLLEANQAFYLAFSRLDSEMMANCWARDEDVVCVHPGWPPIAGWERIRESWEAIFGSTAQMSFVLADEQVTIEEGGERGHVQLIENIESRTASGATRAAILARNSFVLRDGEWLMTAHVAVPSVGA